MQRVGFDLDRAGLRSQPVPAGISHAVQFYEADEFLEDAIAGFLAEGVSQGEAGVLIAQGDRRRGIAERFQDRGLDFEEACATDLITYLEVDSTLAQFMVGGAPDERRFRESVGGILERARGARGGAPLRAYGEMVDVLWHAGNAAGALQLEQLWNDLSASVPFTLLCAYAIENFRQPADGPLLEQVMLCHTHALPADGFARIDDESARAREVVRLQQKARALESEIEHRRTLERQLRAALEHRAHIERNLVAARDEAERASKAKSQFLAVMSHELRTPLNAIMGFGSLLAEEVGGPLTGEQRRFLGRMDVAARQLLGLIDQVLGLARIEAGKEEIEIESIDARAAILDAATLFEPAVAQKGLTMRLRLGDEPVPCRTDGGKLRQILLNLLSNAVKFTSAGTIEARLEQDGAELLLEVRDSGVGISPDDLERVFERFVQLENHVDPRQQGTGLGLAVSRELARLLGGDLTAFSTPGVGSVFSLRIPVDLVAVAAEPAA